MFCPRCGTTAARDSAPCARCGASLVRPPGPATEAPVVRAPTNRGEIAQRAAGIEARPLPKAPLRPRPQAVPPAHRPTAVYQPPQPDPPAPAPAPGLAPAPAGGWPPPPAPWQETGPGRWAPPPTAFPDPPPGDTGDQGGQH